MPHHPSNGLSESQARRASALRSALGPLTALLDDPRVVEVMLNADGVVWVDWLGEGLLRTPVIMGAADADLARHALASRIETLVRGRGQLAFRRDAPAGGKDWNEILQRVEPDFIRLLPGRARGRAGPER